MRAVIAATPGANLSVPDAYPLIYSPIAQSWRPAGTTNAYLTTAGIPNDVKLAILRNAVVYHDNSAVNPRVIFHPNMSRQIAAVYLPGSVNPGGAVGGGDSFLGSGFDLGLKATGFTPAMGHQIIPVPEPETYATGLLLLLGGAWWMWRKRSVFTT